MVVLQAGELSNLPFSPDVQSAYFQVRAELLGSVAAQSKQGVRVVVPNATHSIHLVQPQTVIDTIRQVVCPAQGGMLSSCEPRICIIQADCMKPPSPRDNAQR